MARTQQYELYAAERTLADLGPAFKDSDELQQFVDNLRDAWWWRKWYARVLRVEAELLPRHDSVGAYFDDDRYGRIEMSGQNHARLQYVLHELAHVLAACRYGSDAHDPAFARVYLELTYLVRGSEDYAALAAAFDGGGIVY